jgi:cystathionine beta-synthase
MSALADADGALVLIDGKPAGVVTRHDMLAYVSATH